MPGLKDVVWAKAAGEHGRRRTPLETKPHSLLAKRERVLTGKGALVLALGLVAPFVLYWVGDAVAGRALATALSFVGLVSLFALVFLGSRQAFGWRCGNCKGSIASEKVRTCPHCKARLK